MENNRLWSRDFLTISFSSFFIYMNFYILAVTLPSFVLDNLQGSKEQIGLVTTVFVIAAVIFRPLTGKWLGEMNRRMLVAASLVLFTLCSVCYLVIHDFYWLLGLRFVQGIAFGVATTATSAIVLDAIPDARKGEGIGYFSLFMSLAMVMGPFLGLLLEDISSFTVLFVTVSAFSLFSLMCGLTVRIPALKRVLPTTSGGFDIKRYIEPKSIPISLAGFLLAFSYGAISTFISVYAKSIGIPAAASYFFVVFAAMILISRPFTGRLFDRRGPHPLVYPGIVLFVAGMIWLSQALSMPVFLAAGAVIGLGYGALMPSFQTLSIQAAPAHRRGLATGTYFVFFDLGYGFGSYILGYVAAQTNYRTMYFAGAIVTLLAVLFYYFLHHKRNAPLAPQTSQN